MINLKINKIKDEPNYIRLVPKKQEDKLGGEIQKFFCRDLKKLQSLGLYTIDFIDMLYKSMAGIILYAQKNNPEIITKLNELYNNNGENDIDVVEYMGGVLTNYYYYNVVEFRKDFIETISKVSEYVKMFWNPQLPDDILNLNQVDISEKFDKKFRNEPEDVKFTEFCEDFNYILQEIHQFSQEVDEIFKGTQGADYNSRCYELLKPLEYFNKKLQLINFKEVLKDSESTME